MHAVLYAALFFETSTDDECDPDLAVKQLEQLASSLRQLSADEQEVFRAFAHREAESDPRPSVSRQIRALAESLIPAA